jgi:putative oxidoreductase
MSLSETISPLIGRWLLVWFYAGSARHIATDWQDVADQLVARHVPLPPLAMLVVLVLLAIGMLSLAVGYQARHGAVMLFGLTIAAAFFLHDYWRMADPALRQMEREIFTRDVAICGGLLILIGLGPGPFSIDARGGKKK